MNITQNQYDMNEEFVGSDDNRIERGKKRGWFINFIFFILMASNMVTNVDHGALPAATTEIKTDLGLDNQQLGFLGTLVYLGLTFGNYKN
jgi:hypothetical protein